MLSKVRVSVSVGVRASVTGEDGVDGWWVGRVRGIFCQSYYNDRLVFFIAKSG